MIGHWEIIAIIAIILLIFGPTKLPALGKSLGEGIGNLRKGLRGDDEESKRNFQKVDGQKEDSEQKKD